jgi:hypothetical protein
MQYVVGRLAIPNIPLVTGNMIPKDYSGLTVVTAPENVVPFTGAGFCPEGVPVSSHASFPSHFAQLLRNQCGSRLVLKGKIPHSGSVSTCNQVVRCVINHAVVYAESFVWKHHRKKDWARQHTKTSRNDVIEKIKKNNQEAVAYRRFSSYFRFNSSRKSISTSRRLVHGVAATALHG